eukprot:1153237-Pelagomonas_calceolata.AAC.7
MAMRRLREEGVRHSGQRVGCGFSRLSIWQSRDAYCSKSPLPFTTCLNYRLSYITFSMLEDDTPTQTSKEQTALEKKIAGLYQASIASFAV